MDKDKDRRTEILEEEGVVEVTPPGEGSGGVQELPPSPQEAEGESGGGRGIREKEQKGVGDPWKEVSLVLDDLEVNHKVKVTLAIGNAIGVVEMGMDPSKLGGSLVNLKPSPVMNSATGSLEDQEVEVEMSEMSSEKYTGEQSAHPCLFIENVLDMIFKHIIEQPRTRQYVAKDVRSIRLVCKTWKDAVTLAYRRSAPTIIFEFNVYDQNTDIGLKSLKEFMDTMKLSKMIPVQKFKLSPCASRYWNPKLFGDFLRICGPEVASLDIYLTPGDAEKLTLDSNSLPDFNMPKLKTLKLEIFDLVSREAQMNNIDIETEHHEILDLVGRLLIAAKTLHFFGLYYPLFSILHVGATRTTFLYSNLGK